MDVAADTIANEPDGSLRTTAAGRIRGRCVEGVCTFLGVPYAQPPIGENRFREPQPALPWEGVRPAIDPGDCAPHRIRDFPVVDITPLVGSGGLEGTDYLTLNIWTASDAKGAPVMVWVHGGAFLIGSKDAATHDGTEFARSGMVCVAINYRLGIDGFLPIPGIPTNLGLRDIIAALKWVQDNIEAFGGDPQNVTAFGESAGAMALADLVTSPLAEGLFRRVIIESGHGSMIRSIDVAHRLVRKLAKLLKIAPDRSGFAGVDNATVWVAIQKLAKPFARIDLRDSQGLEPVFGVSRFTPVYGDDVLPEKPLDALKKGAGRDIDILIGTNASEMNLYFVPTNVREKAPRLLLRWLLGKSHPKAGKVLRAYGWGRAKKPGHAFVDALHDLVFRTPARRFAEEHSGHTHVYEFDWQSPACGGELGASHGMEVPFVFKTLSTVTGPNGLVGENPPHDLAERIHEIWVGFARDGSLSWPEFDREHRNVRLLGSDKTVEEPVMAAAEFLP